MEMFIDAYDWVMVPNVYGMSLFADGGVMSTKPYISGSNYVLKMSNYPKGDWTEIWDALFWNFINENQAFFSKNPRLGMMLNTWNKMNASQKEHTRRLNVEDFTQRHFFSKKEQEGKENKKREREREREKERQLELFFAVIRISSIGVYIAERDIYIHSYL